MTIEPDWLTWTRGLQALAQSGLTFTKDKYDRERYEAMRTLSSRMMAMYTGVPATQIEALFEGEIGYATPKSDVRGGVRFTRADSDGPGDSDSGRWTLPGGWADVNPTVTENVVKEVREESGFDVACENWRRSGIARAKVIQPGCSRVVNSFSFVIFKAAQPHRFGNFRGWVVHRTRLA